MKSQFFRATSVVSLSLIVTASWAGARQITRDLKTATPMLSQQSTATSAKHPATLAQLMRGIMFPNSNIIFASQSKKFDLIPNAKDPAASTDAVAGTYGHWEAVENSSLAIVEAASLIEVPGRLCSNGRPAPTANADWPKLVQGLRDAGMQSYQAAKSKDRDKILDATEALTNACGNCHTKYRDLPKLEDRCR
jgi:hypothetical protein